MSSKKPSNVMLAISLGLNLLLVAGMLWMGLSARRAMLGLIAESATAEIEMQKQILTELESGQADRVDALKAALRLNIDVARRMRYKIDTGLNQ